MGARPVGFAALSLWLALADCSGHAAERPVVDLHGLTDIQGVDLMPAAGSIHGLIVAKLDSNPEPGVFYLKSTDAGRSWTPPVRVNIDGSTVATRRGNDAQLAIHGKQIAAVWQSRGEVPGSGPMRLAYSGDGGRTWAMAESPSIDDPAQTQSYFDLAADRRGRFHLVWLDDREERGNTQGLRYARSADAGRSWKALGTVDEAVCTCCWNRLAVLQDDSIAVLYRDDAPHDMRLAFRSRHSAGWADLGPVGAFNWRFQGCPHCGGGLVSTSVRGGEILHGVVWTGEQTAAGLYHLVSRDGGRHWSPPLKIADGHSREADIAALSANTLGIVYSAPGPGGGAIYFQRSNDGGRRFSKPKILSAADANADHPRILPTPQGFRVLWTERVGSGRVLAMAIPTS